MQNYLDDHFPSSDIEILAINNINHESQNDVAADLADLPLLQDVDSNQDNLADTWTDWDVTYRDVQVIDSNGEVQDIYNLTTDGNLQLENDFNTLRDMIIDVATSNRVAASEWQNEREPLDTTLDDQVSPVDVLNTITVMDSGGGPRKLTAATTAKVDTTGDGFLSAGDVLKQLIHLNAVNSNLSSGSGEPNADEAFLASLTQEADDDDDAGIATTDD